MNLKSYLEFHSDIFKSQNIYGFKPVITRAGEAKKAKANTILEKQSVKINTSNIVSKKATQVIEKFDNLESLKRYLLKFDGLDICKMATNLVFGEGVETSKVLLIGEAPGEEEDLQGVPFCGRSGQLLNEALKTVGLSRQTNCYITNTIFWRPPGNRPPTDEEIRTCLPFVQNIIEVIKPNFIICVGSISLRALTGDNNVQISKARGVVLSYNHPVLGGVPFTAIYHPSYLLRSPFKKKDCYTDLLKLESYLT
jgi:DNA polymerase